MGQKPDKLHIIYIPGLGDRNLKPQAMVVKYWRRYGVNTEFYSLNWSDDEPWELKYKKLLARIDLLAEQHMPIALIGASAGAAAVINAFADRQSQIVGCVLIAGKVNRPEVICPRYKISNPSFVTAANNCPEALKKLDNQARKRILSIYGLFDETVQRADSHIDGANNKRSLTIGHFVTIGSQIVLKGSNFIKFINSLS